MVFEDLLLIFFGYGEDMVSGKEAVESDQGHRNVEGMKHFKKAMTVSLMLNRIERV